MFAHVSTGDLLAMISAPLAAVAAIDALLSLIARLPTFAPRRTNIAVAVISVGAMFLTAAATFRWLLEEPHTPLPSARRLAPVPIPPG